MIKSVISDIGKVIVEFDNSIFLKKISKFSAYSLEEILTLSRGNRELLATFDKGKISPQDFYAGVTEILSAKLDYEHFFKIYNDIFFLKHDVIALYQGLKPNYRMVILSNTDVERLGFIKKTFPEILLFDDFVLSFEEGYLKPQHKIYEIAVQRAQARPDECVFIDDREENVRAAEELDIKTIHFTPATDLKAELIQLGVKLK